MSNIRTTLTPFIDEESLIESLDEMNINYNQRRNKIVLKATGRGYEELSFEFENKRFVFKSDDEYLPSKFKKEFKNSDAFLKQVEKHYRVIFSKKEKEALRVAFVQEQRNKIIEKAKKNGYKVKETKVNGKIKLVLKRNVY